MNSSAVPGCFELTGMQKLSLPTGIPSLHFWNLKSSGLSTP